MASDITDGKFAHLGMPRRIWTVSAIHADSPRLTALHDALYERIRPGDRLVYLGNYFGQGPAPLQTIDELLGFRRMVMALPGMMAEDIVYLRGGYEEMWQKLLQVQFTPRPAQTLGWLLEHGLAAPLESYGISIRDGLTAAQESVVALTRWTSRIRDVIRRCPGHDIFSMQWRRAAHTATDGPSRCCSSMRASIRLCRSTIRAIISCGRAAISAASRTPISPSPRSYGVMTRDTAGFT